ncbi:MAG: hypothetical protein ACYTGZ_00695 [Planctomycetota bacterium]
MERGTFLTDRIQEAFEKFVEIRIHTDHPEEELRRAGKKLQGKRFKTLTVPYYAVLDSTGKVVFWSKGGVMSEDEFLAGLNMALDGKKAQR